MHHPLEDAAPSYTQKRTRETLTMERRPIGRPIGSINKPKDLSAGWTLKNLKDLFGGGTIAMTVHSYQYVVDFLPTCHDCRPLSGHEGF